MTSGAVNALEVRSLSKTFGTFAALRNVDLVVAPHEIHALIGENGSGKSTLVKCLSGYHHPDPDAEVRVNGTLLPPTYGPVEATALGLAFVHQDLGLIDSLSVAANIHIGARPETGPLWRLKARAEYATARALLHRLGHRDIDPRAPVGSLSIASQTIVAFARCLHHAGKSSVIVLDEPTASLSEGDVKRLHETVRRAARDGHGIIYISHRLDELYALANRVTVLRDGVNVGTRDIAALPRAELVELIIGGESGALYPEGESTVRDQIALRATGISGNIVRDVSLTAFRGETLGIAGLLGCGKSELGRLLFGAQRITQGGLEVAGKPVRFKRPEHGIRAGVALVPADRHRNGAVMDETVLQNITLLDVRSSFRTGWLRKRAMASTARRLVREYDVRPAEINRVMRRLSGGNQQKVILAKWMHRSPAVLVLDEPAHGVDIGAKSQVFALIKQAADSGAAVIVISEEFEDLAQLCDRVLVMRKGEIVASLSGGTKTRAEISRLVYAEAEQPAGV
jgi:ribose transport system ATP-binding protein